MRYNGQDFVQYYIAKMAGRGHVADEQRFADDRFGRNSPASRILRDASAMTTIDGGSGLLREAFVEFMDSVHARTIIGRLSGIRRVPLETRLITTTAASGARWTAQGAPKPMRAPIGRSTRWNSQPNWRT